MNTSTQNTGRKRTTLIVALVACLVLAVGAGVFAWFSAEDTEKNTFINGSGITDPEVKPDPNNPTEPGTDPTVPETDGNIIETEWNPDSPLTPGSVTPKNPNMGIGKDSQPAYVFAMVENDLPADAYFVLGKGWKPVDGYFTEYTGAKHSTITDGNAKTYKSGLFVYVGDGDDWAMLAPTPAAGDLGEAKANYTGELFDKVYTSDTFKWGDKNKGSITVSSYFAAASGDNEYAPDSGQTQLTAEAKDEIKTSVEAWAAKVKNPLP